MIDTSPYECVYPYGSRVYGTQREDSDWDFICVQETKTEYPDSSINVFTPKEFQDLLSVHEISALETLWVEPLKANMDFAFELDLSKLRISVSAKQSNSWVKAKKKMQQGDNLIGVKSLWHSLRILGFGTQIASDGKITNYSQDNHIWEEIHQDYLGGFRWEDFDAKYRPLHLSKSTLFKKMCPKT